jgi:hypothetical protein
MVKVQTCQKWTIPVLILALLLLLSAVLMASGHQVSLPLSGIQSNRQVMPPDPNEWCRKVDLEKLNTEIVKAETFMREGVGERLVDWRYLRRALKVIGVQVSGPEDSYWLETIKGLYAGCGP